MRKRTFFKSWLARATPDRKAVGSPLVNAARLYINMRSSVFARDTICTTRQAEGYDNKHAITLSNEMETYSED